MAPGGTSGAVPVQIMTGRAALSPARALPSLYGHRASAHSL